MGVARTGRVRGSVRKVESHICGNAEPARVLCVQVGDGARPTIESWRWRSRARARAANSGLAVAARRLDDRAQRQLSGRRTGSSAVGTRLPTGDLAEANCGHRQQQEFKLAWTADRRRIRRTGHPQRRGWACQRSLTIRIGVGTGRPPGLQTAFLVPQKWGSFSRLVSRTLDRSGPPAGPARCASSRSGLRDPA